MATEKQGGDQTPQTEERSLVSFGQTDLVSTTLHPILEAGGFSAALQPNLRRLNDVLTAISTFHGGEQIGFNIEFAPNLEDPQLDFKNKTRSRFKVELASIHRNQAAVRISALDTMNIDFFRLADIQEFAQLAFPDQSVTFRAEPTIVFHGRPVIRLSPNEQLPDSLYEEELKDNKWKEKVREVDENTERVFRSLLPKVEEDLFSINERRLDQLTENVEAVRVRLDFYKKYDPNLKNVRVIRRENAIVGMQIRQLYSQFDIQLAGQYDPLFDCWADNARGFRSQCYVRRFHFSGQPSKVEEVVGLLANLFMKTPTYNRYIHTTTSDKQ